MGLIKAKKSGVGIAYYDDPEGIEIDLWDRTYIEEFVEACDLFLGFGEGIRPEYMEALKYLKAAAERYSAAMLTETIKGRHS